MTEHLSVALVVWSFFQKENSERNLTKNFEKKKLPGEKCTDLFSFAPDKRIQASNFVEKSFFFLKQHGPGIIVICHHLGNFFVQACDCTLQFRFVFQSFFVLCFQFLFVPSRELFNGWVWTEVCLGSDACSNTSWIVSYLKERWDFKISKSEIQILKRKPFLSESLLQCLAFRQSRSTPR